jgi:type I restriction enzyme, S subunit
LNGPDALLNQRIARIALLSDDIHSFWLLFAVNACVDKWKSERSNLTAQNIKAAQLSEAVIPVPPLAEQHRIVAKVDELLALCDRLEATRAEREKTRDRLAAASFARLDAPDPDPCTFAGHARFALESLPALTTRSDPINQLRQTILNLAVRGKLVEQEACDEPAALGRDNALGENGRKATIKPTKLEDSFALPNRWNWSEFGDAPRSRTVIAGRTMQSGTNTSRKA